jgi:hypothetical protein
VAWLALGCAGNCDYNKVVDGLIKLQHVMFCLHASIEVCEISGRLCRSLPISDFLPLRDTGT